MSTDELSFPDVFDALRELRHDIDPSAGWEREQRARLLTFIETGTVEVSRTADPTEDADVVAFDVGVESRPRLRVAVAIAVAASAVLLVAGLVVAPRWRGAEVPPATLPSTTEDGVVPFPDRYPVLPAGHPMESRVTALFDGQLDWDNEPQSWMIVGRVVDDVVVDAVRISTTAASPDEAASRLVDASPGEPVEALGSGWMLFRDVAEVMDVAIGRHGPATLAIAGTDPVGTVARLGGLGATVDTSVDARGQPFLTVNALPDGYRVIAGPEAFVPGAMSARLTIPDGEGAPDPTLPDPVGDEGDGITVYVSMVDPFLMPIDGLRRVDINGIEGWVSTTDGAPMITWKVSDTTWATIWDAADTDAAVAFARSLEFVDQTTWVGRYAVPDPLYPAGPSPGTPTLSVPEMATQEVLVPDRFALVPDGHPLAAQSTAMYGGMRPMDALRVAEALVAIDDGSSLTGAAVLRVYAEVSDDMFPGARPVDIAGLSGRLWTEPGSPSTTTFITDGVPALAVQAADAAAFVDATGGVPIVNVRYLDDRVLTFDVATTLPDGYTTIVPPRGLTAARAVNALTTIPDGDNGDGISVWVESVNPLTTYAPYGDLTRVDINGATGWYRDDGPGSPVIWQVTDATWAMVSGAMNTDDALGIARAVVFVDQTTWEQRYGVETPAWPNTSDVSQEPVGTTTPPLISLPTGTGLGVSTPEGAPT